MNFLIKLTGLGRRNVLKAAHILASAGLTEAAKTLVLYLASPRVFQDAHLALANLAHQKTAWLQHVNAFFNSNRLPGITLTGGGPPSFSTLAGQPLPQTDTPNKVSVIMSAFNAEQTIGHAMRSILDQSWRDLELIVVDDCSTDATVDLVETLMKADRRIRLIRNPVNAGTYVCRNRALDQCTGEFVTTQDSDDWAHPDRLRIQAGDLISHPEQPANMTRNVRMTGDGRFELTSYGTYTTYRCCASFMMRASTVKPVFGYWDSVRVSADNEYIERMLAVLGPSAVKIIPQPLMIQLRREDSLTTAPLTLGVGGKLSAARRQYQNAYMDWHRGLQLQNCRLPFPVERREFFAPAEIEVPFHTVQQALGVSS